MPTLWAHVAVLVTSTIASIMNSIAGGGTFIAFPALIAAGHVAEKSANMTCTIGLWPGSASSILAARDDFKTVPRSMLWLFLAASLLGGLAGALLLVLTSNQTFRYVIPWLLLFATALFGFSEPIARWSGRHHAASHSRRWTAIVCLIQLLVALYGGYFGAGIGVLMLAGLSFAGLENLHQVNALKVLLSTAINAVALLLFVFASLRATSPADQINWPFAVGMMIVSTAGGFYGMALARKINPRTLRRIILVIGALLTAAFFYQAYA